ncbi:MAG: carbohydrate binding family 9 domain-containing protein [Chitinophagaceae bacterium]|nr:carbohydrate binding family 9 domain-containing protein [Chitinophagaceae bacterium]
MRLLLFFIFTLNVVLAVAGTEPERNLSAVKVTASPKIDGLLNDEAWKNVAPAENFIVNSPNYGAPESRKTKVYVVYDDAAIYIAAYLYDDPKNIRKQLTPRDGESRQDVDYFSVFFDTYNDDQNGFQFLVTSRNVQSDGRLSANLNSQFGPPSDYSWDAVWESKTSFQKDGWIVEMRIPYFSLRFAQKEVQDWGLNFLRFSRKNNELTYWNNINPNENGFINQFGKLSGLEGLQPPLRLSFLPYVTTGYRSTPSKTGGRTNEVLRNGGMDVKYGVNESFTLDATLIPDFGQVISDNVINNLSPFEVQFQENRPFFTEGTEIFNKAGLFYSRRVGATPGGYYKVKAMENDSINILKNPGIVQLYNATKFSGRNRKKLGIGIFNAIGAPTYAEIENINSKTKERIQTEPLTNYSVIVLDQALKGRSSITLTNTNVMRSGSARDANVTGLDVALFTNNNLFAVRGKFDYSQVRTANPYNGFRTFLNMGKVSGKIQYSLSSNIESDRYDPNDLGILQAPNEVTTIAAISYNQLTPTSKFNSYSYSFNVRHEMLYKPFTYTNTRINARGFWFFKNFWDASLSLSFQPWWQNDYFDLRTPGRMLKKVPFGFIGFEGSSDSRKRLFGRWGFGFAESVDIKNDAYNFIRGGFRYRFSDRFSLDVNINRTDDKGQFGYAFVREVNGDPIIGRRRNTDFTTLINGIYNFTPRMNVTLRARHYWSRLQYQAFYNVKDDGFWTDRPFINGRDQNFNVWNLDMFYTWDFNYGSRLIIGWKNWLGNDFQLPGSQYKNYTSNFAQVLQEPLGNEITVRLIWFIDYNKLRRKAVSR